MIRKYFEAANRRLNSIMGILTPIGVCLGLILGSRVSHLKPLVTYLFAFVTFSGALSMKFSDFLYIKRKPSVVALAVAGSNIVMPLVVFGLASLLFPSSRDTVTGFVLLYSNPTAVVSYVWCTIFGGNDVLSLSLILLSTILAPVFTPYTVKLLTNTSVNIDTTGMMISLLYMVVIPNIIGVTLNTLTKGKAEKEVNPYLKPFTKLCLLLVATINTSQIAGQLSLSLSLLKIASVNILVAFLGFFIGYWLSRFFHLSAEDTVSLSYFVGLRNMNSALVLAVNYFPPVTAVPVMVGLTVQQVIAATFGSVVIKHRKERKEVS